jgi:hypothetical protein
MRNWPAYRKAWMRRWRANPENKGHERALDKLRRWVRLGLISREAFEAELWRKPR